MITLFCNDSNEQLRSIPSDSIDAVVTDPPYGLSFMNKHWDHSVPSVELWREVLRVLKPGGHVLSFGGTRTYHRMVVNIEDAGFEIRDQIQWLYGSGFPKSMDVSKAIDKAAGAEREVVGEKTFADGSKARKTQNLGADVFSDPVSRASNLTVTAPATAAAKQWKGWGTALKPANEPIVLARKPLTGTVAENVQTFGTGALNIDASRIDLKPGETTHGSGRSQSNNPNTGYGDMGEKRVGAPNIHTTQGRWPANVLFDEEAAAVLDAQSGEVRMSLPFKKKSSFNFDVAGENVNQKYESQKGLAYKAGASRFFFVAKASKRERNAGLGDLPLREAGIKNDSGPGFSESDPNKKIMMQNHHPTVKPIKLMEYLVRLITPPGGTVLDPFMGSGTTGIAAKNLGFGFVGIERSEEYFKIAQRRIEGVE